jgi:hypothetical protein
MRELIGGEFKASGVEGCTDLDDRGKSYSHWLGGEAVN